MAKIQMLAVVLGIILLISMALGIVPTSVAPVAGSLPSTPDLTISKTPIIKPESKSATLPQTPVEEVAKPLNTKPVATAVVSPRETRPFKDKREIVALLRQKDFAALEALFAGLQEDYVAGETSDAYVLHAADALRHTTPDLEPLYRTWIASRPQSPYARLARGLHHQTIGWYQRGYKYAGQTPDKRFAQMKLSFAKANADFAAAVALDKHLTVAHAYLINISMASGKNAETKALHDRALRDNPRSSVVRQFYLAHLMPKWGGSIEQIEAYVSEQGKHASRHEWSYLLGYASYARGWGHWAAGRRDRALQEYDKAIAVGSFSHYDIQRGRLLVSMKRYDDAIGSFDSALARWPQSVGALHQKARIARIRGDREVADKFWRQALEIEPHEPSALQGYAYLHFKAKRYHEAKKLLKRATIYSANDPWTQYTLGNIAYKQKNFADSASHYSKASALRPQNLKYIYWKGASYTRNGYDCRAISPLKSYVAQCKLVRNWTRSACRRKRFNWAKRALDRYANKPACNKRAPRLIPTGAVVGE